MNLPRQKITTGLRNGWRKVNERLAPLAGDRRGSTLALMAAGLIPVIAALGAGIDAGRLYLVKSQLQAGVDAAALAGARAFAWVLIIEGVPQAMADAVIAMNLSPVAFLLMVNLLLLVFGMFMDPLPGVMILVPILAPIANSLGIAADHFAIIVIVNLTFGLITPPVGGLIFVVASATNQRPSALIRELPPFFLAALVVLAILTFVPGLSTWLPAISGFSRG